ncbi:hypothetical protein JCM10450v2_008169 [Rhodotorula kratochvilovae]
MTDRPKRYRPYNYSEQAPRASPGARKAPKAAPQRPQRTTAKGVKGGPDRFGKLPPELQSMIAAHLDPLGLLQFSRTSRANYAWLRSKEDMEQRWKTARLRTWGDEWGTPEDFDVNEVRFVHLVADRSCSKCGRTNKPTILNPVHLLWLCPNCKSMWIATPILKRSYTHLHPQAPSCCRSSKGDRWKYWLPERESQSAKLYALQREPAFPDPDRPGYEITAVAAHVKAMQVQLAEEQSLAWRGRTFAMAVEDDGGVVEWEW